MIWNHKGKMCWVCKDVPGMIIEVVIKDDKKWLFTAISTNGGTVLESSTHKHPIDAMNMADKFKDNPSVS